MTKSRKRHATGIQDSIRKILFSDWDPIGVRDNPLLSDEYDRYIAPVYRVLVGSRSEDELIELLHLKEREEIGMPCESREQLRPVARKLLALDFGL
jgi:hypothetical protein